MAFGQAQARLVVVELGVVQGRPGIGVRPTQGGLAIATGIPFPIITVAGSPAGLIAERRAIEARRRVRFDCAERWLEVGVRLRLIEEGEQPLDLDHGFAAQAPERGKELLGGNVGLEIELTSGAPLGVVTSWSSWRSLELPSSHGRAPWHREGENIARDDVPRPLPRRGVA
ncbi:hypothetical protein QA635_18645 [Bradyrhizobium brasilense]|uniref:hypothetical protein n=1 Tax=Bradyrhizobium brasilense TaxID=1419277 RepID=UPI0024B17907|nr:hypothetical protein [Bradyrhizobium australafricanum]WFU36316.1 hypothetical protein QA635_18645 [Bradyrhizobium australafricanum]